LPQRGGILRHVKPVTSQGERAFRDLSPSTSRPAIATRRTGFEARWNEPSARSPNVDGVEELCLPNGLVRLRRVPNPLVPLVAAQRWRHSLLHAPESHTANAGPIRRSSRSRAPSWPGTTDVHKADPCGHEHCRQIVTAVRAAEGPFQCAPAIGRSGAGYACCSFPP